MTNIKPVDMFFLQAPTYFKVKELLLGGEDWGFLGETIFRTSFMFIVILVGLRVMGKRGVKQLSVFELVVIIGLGSAAGDPMFYKDVGILPALVVFVMVILLYRIITFFLGKSKRFEDLLEGKPVCIIRNGMFSIDNFKKETFGEDEFFSELRMQGVSQLGQVEEAIIESSGELSIFFYTDEAVIYGLPVMPGSLEKKRRKISSSGHYACAFCGLTKLLEPLPAIICNSCGKDEWVEASNRKRVS